MSNLIKSTAISAATFSLSLAQKAREFLTPVTPKQVSALLDSGIQLAKNAYESPYETTKSIIPTRIVSAGEYVWTSYGTKAVSKSQAVVASSTEFAGKSFDNVKAVISHAYTFIHSKFSSVTKTVTGTVEFAQKTVGDTVGFVQIKVKQSSDYTLSVASTVRNQAHDLVKSFSKAA
jgi:hypothetical protein